MNARARTVVALATLWLVAPLLLAVLAWPSWWAWIAPERSPMTWLQSVALVLAAAAALLVAHVHGLGRHQPATGRGQRHAAAARPPAAAADPRPWWLLAAGFAALAVDERFALHERLRDGVLAPRGVTLPLLPWVAPGDFVLLAVTLVGLALLPTVWRALAGDRAARRALVVGVGCALLAVGVDAIDPASWTDRAERVQQTAEEIVELAGCLALLAAVLLRLLGLLDATTAEPATQHDAIVDSTRMRPTCVAGPGGRRPVPEEVAMASLIVRNLEDDLVRRLKVRAAEHGRSAEEEHREILRAALAAPPRVPLKDLLTSMPDVGADADFGREDDLGRGLDW